MNYYEEALKLHSEHKGKIEVVSKVKLENRDDLSIAYTPEWQNPARRLQRIKRMFLNIRQKATW